jgi:Icc-related predicted phosphoesterase
MSDLPGALLFAPQCLDIDVINRWEIPIMRLAWLTDIHLNFVSLDEVSSLAQRIDESGADAVLVGGDIAEADSFADSLRQLSGASNIPHYFVLGNHDYYRGSIATVREEAAVLSRESSILRWLPDAGVVQLTDKTALVGHGGWGDGRIGKFFESDVVLNDYALVAELQELHRHDILPPESILTPELHAKLGSLGDEAADHFRQVLLKVLKTSERIVVLTHVPPFREACWHEGHLSDDNWAPHFTCQAVGEVLVEFMSGQPNRTMTVLCGHTHSSGHAQILDNLEVFTGEAVYGHPQIQQVLTIE